jgi:hypothetical protein
MSNNQRYRAFWVPGLLDPIDQDEAVAMATDWLAAAEGRERAPGVIVMYAKSMMGNSRELADAAARWEFVSPRSRYPRRAGRGPVLCIYPPDDRTLELAEQLAHGSELCVIPGSLMDLSGWIARSGAECLVDRATLPALPALSQQTRDALDHLARFDGHNQFLGAGGKEYAIRALLEIADERPRPEREAIETYLRSNSEVHGNGAARVGKWYDEVLAGRRHRDYAGRTIQRRGR